MADTAAPAPAAPAAPAPVVAAQNDAALFGKFTAQHQANQAEEAKHAQSLPNSRRPDSGGGGRAASVPDPAAAASAVAAGDDASRADTGTDGDDEGREADDAGAAPRPDPDKAPAGSLSEAEAIALARKARDEGDMEALDRALKAILPGSKGLAEFQVDGKRYGELRTVTKRAQKKLDEREQKLSGREQNLERGLSTLNQVVSRLEPIEQLVVAARDESPEGVAKFVELVQKATGKPINETLKRYLNNKLEKPVDPEVEAVKRELADEKKARLDRERQEEEARQTAARRVEIGQHLKFLDETLSKSEDQAVRALVKTQAGMKAIFEAQQAHYNPQTRRTISAEQAARHVLEQKRKEIEPWQQVLAPKALPAPAPAPTEPDAPRVRSLGSRGAAPASGGAQRLSDAELFDKYERLAKLAGD